MGKALYRQALYRKYRSTSLAEIVGQEHITETLSKALQSGRVSHAYLFTGPRGVGKTSIARILAHELNQQPYDGEQTYIDIVEIDAASNNGVEDVRDLREKIHTAPVAGKYKVYIIDEVHMLSKAAFNALLKTLEEPPAHVIFILATTEAHKVPETIISRTQRYVFRPIESVKAHQHLRTIADQEDIDISDAALDLIVKHSDGSFRDSISLLDQASNQAGRIEVSDIQNQLGLPPAQAISDVIAALQRGDLAEIARQLDTLYNQGLRATAIATQLCNELRDLFLQGKSPVAAERTLALLEKLLLVASSNDAERFLEIILLEAAPTGMPVGTAPIAVPISPQQSSQPAAVDSVKVAHDLATDSNPIQPALAGPVQAPKTVKKTAKVTAHNTSSKSVASSQLNEDNWRAVLDELKKRYNTLYGIVRMAQPDFSQSDMLGLTFAFAFHQKRMSEVKNQQIVSEAVTAVIGRPITIVCQVDPELKLGKQAPAAKTALPEVPVVGDDASLSVINDIFGASELLQS